MNYNQFAMPILPGINDIPSISGQPNHPNASLMCDQHNQLLLALNGITGINNTQLTSQVGLVKIYTQWADPERTIAVGTFQVVDGSPGNDGADGNDGNDGAPGEVQLDVQNTFTKSQQVALVTLVDAPTIVVDASLGNVFNVTLAGNRTLANPTNLVAGQTLNFIISQDAVGSRTLAYDTLYKFPFNLPPVISTQINSITVISCIYNGSKLLSNAVIGYEVS